MVSLTDTSGPGVIFNLHLTHRLAPVLTNPGQDRRGGRGVSQQARFGPSGGWVA
jgi:hypothetical protein